MDHHKIPPSKYCLQWSLPCKCCRGTTHYSPTMQRQRRDSMNQIQMKQNLQRAPLDSPCMMKVHKMRSAVTALTELFDGGTEHHVSADCLSDLGVIHKSKGVNMQNWMCHYILPAPWTTKHQFRMLHANTNIDIKNKRSRNVIFPINKLK